jgi:hypothetical protein
MDHALRTATLDDGLDWSGCSRRSKEEVVLVVVSDGDAR